MRSILARSFRFGGLVTLSAMVAFLIPSAAIASDPPNIRQGSSGHWVSVAQQDLTDIGYALPVDGSFGTRMTAKVDKFKKAHHLPVNGQIAWPNAWRTLRKAARREQRIPEHYAHLNSKGLAVAPKNAPVVIRRVIQAANAIAYKPYVYGGGHGSWKSSGYDCSGSVSYALHGGGLLWYPEDSTELETYGTSGWGKWIRIYANAGHAYMKVAGLWFDTVAQNWGSPGHGDRWSTKRATGASGYIVRHPIGF